MKTTHVVSDVHGKPEKLREALFSAQLFDNHGLKDPKAYILQIGDNGNCVKSSLEGDRECFDMVGKEIDAMLIGNHEIPYFDPDNYFSGFHYYEEIDEKLHELYDAGLLFAARTVNGVLITHAGVHKSKLIWEDEPAEEVADKLNGEWFKGNFKYSLFASVGWSRGGSDKIGGMLWCDFDREFQPTKFPQIVGHTPGGLRMKGNALCIDTGAKMGGTPTVLRLENQ